MKNGTLSGGFMAREGRTGSYIHALEAVRALLQAHGPEAVGCVYAEVLADQRREAFATSRGLRRAEGDLCVQRLLGKRCNSKDCTPPGGDHDTLWLKDGKPALYLAQPYQLCWPEMLKLVAFCSQHGLEADITTWPSFHFPGDVLSIGIQKAGNANKL